MLMCVLKNPNTMILPYMKLKRMGVHWWYSYLPWLCRYQAPSTPVSLRRLLSALIFSKCAYEDGRGVSEGSPREAEVPISTSVSQ
jgi:hypothetical protein